MKKTLIVLCSAIALAFAGCERDTGAPGTDTDTGYGTDRGTMSPGGTARDTNTWNGGTSSILTNTNNAIGAPGSPGTGTQPGTDDSRDR